MLAFTFTILLMTISFIVGRAIGIGEERSKYINQ